MGDMSEALIQLHRKGGIGYELLSKEEKVDGDLS